MHSSVSERPFRRLRLERVRLRTRTIRSGRHSPATFAALPLAPYLFFVRFLFPIVFVFFPFFFDFYFYFFSSFGVVFACVRFRRAKLFFTLRFQFGRRNCYARLVCSALCLFASRPPTPDPRPRLGPPRSPPSALLRANAVRVKRRCAVVGLGTRVPPPPTGFRRCEKSFATRTAGCGRRGDAVPRRARIVARERRRRCDRHCRPSSCESSRQSTLETRDLVAGFAIAAAAAQLLVGRSLATDRVRPARRHDQRDADGQNQK